VGARPEIPRPTDGFGKGYPVRDQLAVRWATTDDARDFFGGISQCAVIFSEQIDSLSPFFAIFFFCQILSHRCRGNSHETITINR